MCIFIFGGLSHFLKEKENKIYMLVRRFSQACLKNKSKQRKNECYKTLLNYLYFIQHGGQTGG